MKHTILVVDDEASLTLSLKDYLMNKGYNALVAYNADEALKIINADSISLVLSDINMPNKTGLEFFKEFKEKIDTENKIPFVLMTAFASLDIVQSAFAMKIDEIIAKPFDLEAISIIIDYLLNSPESAVSEKEVFFSVPIEEMILSKKSDFNIFLKLDNKYVRVTKSGQSFTQQRLDNFAKKGMTLVYLNASDFAKYTELQFSIASAVSKRPLEESKKRRIMHQLMSSISQSSLADQIDKDYLKQSTQALESYTSIALRNPQLNTIINNICAETPDLAAQSTLKAILASSVAYLWRWDNPKVQGRIM